MYSQFVCSLVSCNVCKANRDDRTSLTLMHLVDILTIIACGLPSRVRVPTAQTRADRMANVKSDASRLLARSPSTEYAFYDLILYRNTCKPTPVHDTRV